MIGHKKIIDDLQKLSTKDRLSHGYIFHGPSMVGKRVVAQGLAKFLEKGEFEAPLRSEVLQDSMMIERTNNSIGIDAVREIKNFLWQKPNVSSRRTLIIDEAELLTTEAQNALLKVTEEPPASSLLLIVTSDLESIMPTIQSRLPKIYFGAVPEADIVKWLVAEHALTAAKAAPFAARAVGKPGLAWRLAFDKEFQKKIELAEKFLKTSTTTRKDFIKKLIEPDEFSLRTFLDAVIITLAWEKASKGKASLWHKALELQQNATNFGLNPRLQLESLLM